MRELKRFNTTFNIYYARKGTSKTEGKKEIVQLFRTFNHS